jgi:hypothetical protein
MTIQLLRQASSSLLLGILLGVSLSPVAAGLLVCTAGIAPDCCRDTGSAPPSSSERGPTARASCDCCVTLDAIPSDLSVSPQKSFLDSMARSANFDDGVILPPGLVARAMANSSGETGLLSPRSLTLRI